MRTRNFENLVLVRFDQREFFNMDSEKIRIEITKNGFVLATETELRELPPCREKVVVFPLEEGVLSPTEGRAYDYLLRGEDNRYHYGIEIFLGSGLSSKFTYLARRPCNVGELALSRAVELGRKAKRIARRALIITRDQFWRIHGPSLAREAATKAAHEGFVARPELR